MTSYAVIGAGYGDEGKGVVTDFLTSQLLSNGKKPIVARCNGGGQAGHTVQSPEGLRHVFKHHGSGSLLGAPTYLSADFIVNLFGFRKENEELKALGVTPKVAVSPDSIVTLPIDEMINQAKEVARGDKKHGSCGWGIGETVQRSLAPPYIIRVKDLETLTLGKLLDIKETYLPLRLAEQELESTEAMSNSVYDIAFLKDARYFLDNVEIVPDEKLLEHGDCVVFEGAQGLGLDQDGGHFPYVTRSSTGLNNIDALAKKAGIQDVQIVYVTRCYATRHGAGPLEWEGIDVGVTVEDPTNITNEWQDSLRVAPLDLNLLARRVQNDAAGRPFRMAVTCVDQIEDEVNVVLDGKLIGQKPYQVGYLISETCGATSSYEFSGPSRADVSLCYYKEAA